MSQGDIERERQRQEDMQIHQNNLGTMVDQNQHERANLIETTVETELEEPSRQLLHNLASKDIPLANFKEEDIHEQKWFQEIVLEKFKAAHPHSKSVLQGVLREWAFDDPTESFEALDPTEHIEGDTFNWGTYSRATRAEKGFQQETNSKQVRETVARSPDREKSSGGLLGRWRS